MKNEARKDILRNMFKKRPPVVVVLGSVDHGKTTLLDYIRKTTVAAKEAGGITQAVGAYEIEIPHTVRDDFAAENRKITFIDTPGHEAFTKMRSRGTKIADIAILVVAADDSVKPQTKEAIKIILDSKTPYVVAINKIDKQPDANKVKNDLMQASVLLEGYGGNIPFQPVSAKTGEGVNELLDLILLVADQEDLKYDPEQKAKGYVLESKTDSRRGILASLIIKDGTLKIGDEIFAGKSDGKVRSLENFLGEKIDHAEACAPVLITGFNSLPKIGDEFEVGKLLPTAPTVATKIIGPSTTGDTQNKNLLRLILKSDVSGSVEALSEVIRNLPAQDKTIKIIEEGVGEITDGDVKMAISTKAAIVGFKTKITKAAENLAREHRIQIIHSEIIYELIKAVEEELLTEKEKFEGKLEILATFSKKNRKQLIGGKILEGEIKVSSFLQVERNKTILGKGKILSLQQNKKEVKRVGVGLECGLIFESDILIAIGDILVAKL